MIFPDMEDLGRYDSVKFMYSYAGRGNSKIINRYSFLNFQFPLCSFSWECTFYMVIILITICG